MKSRAEHEVVLRAIPPVKELLDHPLFQLFPVSRPFLKRIIQQEIERFRQQVVQQQLAITPESVARRLQEQITNRLRRLVSAQLTRVINATGIIAHTNLGRAPLAPAAIEAIRQLAGGYCNLEFQLASGGRGRRESNVETLLQLLTGAEAALVVNNNAAAVLLVLHALARRREVIVSRGELVEIGGSFRLPEVLQTSGARLVEIGTTNKTRLDDYRKAIGPRTAAILKVHPSNYRVVGFTQSVAIQELSPLCRNHGIPLIYDLGSGALVDLQQWQLPAEPVASRALQDGADIVTFSGDKVLGGPQAGIIIGKKAYLDKIRRHPLTRALRCDKLTYAALEATLRLYLQPESLPQHLPVLHLLTTPVEHLRQRAQTIVDTLTTRAVQARIVPSTAQMGSGALPLETIPSIAVELTPRKFSAATIARKLRQNSPPIIGYVQDEKVFLDMRTVDASELAEIIKAINRL
ncbi:MAG: L-seryl-tRNA(Sec) selenium transferase [Calditrichaeota bacterium]|nr:L-seryl-tRNA(Sec) selenium transferase [Calditrichota bacterium]